VSASPALVLALRRRTAPRGVDIAMLPR
jgi:hypothetical protein